MKITLSATGIIVLVLSILSKSALAQNSTVSKTPSGNSSAYYCQQGIAAQNAGNVAAAVEAYKAALKADPQNANAEYLLREVQLHAGEISKIGRKASFGKMIVPLFRLEDANLKEALEALSLVMEKHSEDSTPPNFVILDPLKKLDAAKITLNLKGIPAREILNLIVEQAHAKASFSQYTRVISPLG